MTGYTETALAVDCDGDAMIGVLSLPAVPSRRALLIVVGGPQYRAGSHRQFTLLARGVAAAGTAVLRFDYRGMGDSDGAPRSFDRVGADLRAAIDGFFNAQPTLESVVLWGLCDGACAALFHAATDRRVSGVVLLNPWLRTEAGAARTQLRHYYTARLLAPDFWRKLVGGGFDFRAAASGFGATLRTLAAAKKTQADRAPPAEPGTPASLPLPQAMQSSFAAFDGKILLILSGRDLTAKEFLDHVQASRAWRGLLGAPRITRHDLDDADHTFSRRAWRDQVTALTVQWLASW